MLQCRRRCGIAVMRRAELTVQLIPVLQVRQHLQRVPVVCAVLH